jgi:hypothetical protein
MIRGVISRRTFTLSPNMISPKPRQSSPIATPRVISAPVKARDPPEAEVADGTALFAAPDEPDEPDDPEPVDPEPVDPDPVEPDDAEVEPAAVVVVPPPDPLVVVVEDGIVVEVVVLDAVVVLVVEEVAMVVVVVVLPVPGTAVQTNPLGSLPLAVKVTTLFQ